MSSHFFDSRLCNKFSTMAFISITKSCGGLCGLSMIWMLSIYGFLGHGPIILAAAPLTIGNNDLLMLTSHLLSSTDSCIFVGFSLSVSKQPLSFLLVDPFLFFSNSGRSGLYFDYKRLISSIHGLLARIQPGSNVIKCNPDNIRTRDNATYAIPSPNTSCDKSMMAVSKDNP